MRIEKKILSNLLYNEDYIRKVGPFIDSLYFEDKVEGMVCQEILNFFVEYNKIANPDIIKIELGNRKDITDNQLHDAIEMINSFDSELCNIDWLVESTEKFCKDRAVYNAIVESISIIDGKHNLYTQDSIPKILQDALAVSFDTRTGHDYIKQADERFEYYHRVEEKIPFSLELMNKITAGGLSKKTLSIVLAHTGGGKSMFMCDFAANVLMQGKNVLYLTLEMAEERIARRIDTNLFNISDEAINILNKEEYDNYINNIARKTHGRLVIKEYPTASAHSGHFRALIEELKIKQNFIPDVLIVDYLNICASSRLKAAASLNSYLYVKAIAEELRGLAVEYDIPVLSATQTNRDGFDNSDISLTNTSESFGLPATADLMFAIIRSEELDDLDQIMIKQLKNRYADPSKYKRFVVGVDKSMMKLYDVEQSAQDGIADSGHDDDIPLFDRSKKNINSYKEFNFS